MKDIAECGHSLHWHNCYSGTYDIISPDSFAHPAKMSPSLCYRILKHLQELGLLKEGDKILDPMGGTGITNICAGALGYPSVSVELEEKFIDMCQTYLCPGVIHYTVAEKILPAVKEGVKKEATGGFDENGELEYHTYYIKSLPERKRYMVHAISRCGKKEWHPVHRVIGNKEYAERRLYKSLDWEIIQGDSRNLSSLLKSKGLKSVTSPPYGIDKTSGGLNTKPPRSNKDQSGRSPGSPSQAGAKEGYGETQGQIGNLKDTPLKAITSPPYGEAVVADYTLAPTKGSFSDVKLPALNSNYGETKGQIGALKDTPLKSIVSPPYENALPNGLDRKAAEQLVQAMYDKHGRTYSKEDFEYQVELILKRSNREYGDTEGQIGVLKDKPLKSITSPPYQDSLGHPSLGSVNKDDWGKEGKDIVKRRGLLGEYGDSEGQVGNLKSITSPPYSEAQSGGGIAKKGYTGNKHTPTDLVGNRSYMPEIHGQSEGQIANLKDTPLKAITSPPYSDSLNEKKNTTSNLKREERLRTAGHEPKDYMGGTGRNLELEDGMRYSHNPDNIGNLKDTPLKAIVSPPYADNQEKGSGFDWAKAGRPDRLKPSDKRHNVDGLNSNGYGQTDGQIGQLPDKPLKSVMSPPYGLGKGTGHSDNKRETRPILKDRNVNLAYNDESVDNIGNLPDKPLISITSPPYGDAEKRDRSKEDSNVKEKDYPRGDHNISSGYQASEDNIGVLPDKPLKSVMSPPYDDMLNSSSQHGNTGIAKDNPKLADTGRYGANTQGQIGNEKQESYLQAMLKVYQEISLVSDVLCVVVKNPTRNGKLRRLDLDTIRILEMAGWKVYCQHRALLFEELEQADLFGSSKKRVKGRLSFFKRLSWQNGQPVASWEDVLVCVRK